MRPNEQCAKSVILTDPLALQHHYPITESQIEPVTEDLLWSARLNTNFTLKGRTQASRSRRIHTPQPKIAEETRQKKNRLELQNSGLQLIILRSPRRDNLNLAF